MNNRILIRDMGGRRRSLPRRAPPASCRGARPATPRSSRSGLAQAAEQRGGKLTVAEAVALTGRSFKDVEKVLNRMVVDGYIDVDNDAR